MHWQKLGFIFVADKQHDWMQTHASWPRAFNLVGDVYRIYFSSRDASNRSHIAFVDIDIKNPSEIISISSSPVLSPGNAGLFDDCGVIPCCVIKLHEGTALYYMGLSLAVNVPYNSFCGLAYLNNNLNSATRFSSAPIIERSDIDSYSGGAAFVYFDEKQKLFHMWYESCLGWINKKTSLEAQLAIKYATSHNGICWKKSDVYCISPTEHSNYISTPSVIQENSQFKMWYSYKTGGKFKIGYAESDDGISWVKKDDEAGITVSESGWDSEEIEYPYVFDHKGERYMFYNGNSYGKTGFGLAKLIDD